jgi:hypothetical protein
MKYAPTMTPFAPLRSRRRRASERCEDARA